MLLFITAPYNEFGMWAHTPLENPWLLCLYVYDYSGGRVDPSFYHILKGVHDSKKKRLRTTAFKVDVYFWSALLASALFLGCLNRFYVFDLHLHFHDLQIFIYSFHPSSEL